MGDIVLFQPPAHLQKYADKLGSNSDLTSGVQASFAILSFKGKVWRVKYQGEEKIIKGRDGEPSPVLAVVLVKSSPQISKIYYPGAYTEGDADAPECFSVDGIKPDPGSAKPQSSACVNCKHNIWGSKITEQGNKTKACSDSRRVGVVPYPDVANENFGGPLLLRIPPASLQEFYRFGKYLDSMGVNYTTLVTKIKFDPEAAYPRLMFSVFENPETEQPIWLTADQMDTVIGMRETDAIDRMLAEAPIGEVSETIAEVAQKQAEAPVAPAPAAVPEVAPEPKKETSADAVPDIGLATMGSVDTAAPSESVESTNVASEKPTTREANAEEPKETDSSLDSLIGGLL